jgi:uncharacterized protein YecE (DUF72 family)
MIHLGTSGYSYDDWVGPYYPPDLPKSGWLAFYAREFDTCEINFTFYRMPEARTLAAMASKTNDGFLFTVKATQELTHKRDGDASRFGRFVQALQPLIENNKFGCILAQFPFSFHPTQANREYLRALPERFEGLPVVVELRNASWLSESTFTLLRENRLGFCCVDEPSLKGLIPPIAQATSSVAYVRFHGRNAQKWWNHEQAWERYDYTYSPEELREWLPRIGALDSAAEHTFLFANNHWHGQAVDTARQLRLLLP